MVLIQRLNIAFVVNTRLMPACQNTVRIFKAVAVRGEYRALAGGKNYIAFKAVEFPPAVNIRHLRLRGEIVFSEGAHDFVNVLVVFSCQSSGLLLGGDALLGPAYGHFFYVTEIPLAAVDAVLDQIIGQIFGESQFIHDKEYGAHIVCAQRFFQVLLRHKEKSCNIFICLKIPELIRRVIWLFHRERVIARAEGAAAEKGAVTLG